LLAESGIFLAALGITVLEMAEAAAVGIAIFADTRSPLAYASVALGSASVFVPAALLGIYLELIHIFLLRLASAILLLYFGIRLTLSARRSYRRQRSGHEEHFSGIFVPGFSVGAVEAFEASIVLVALFPENYIYTSAGLLSGIATVVIAAALMHTRIRRLKQYIAKVLVSSLLLSFSVLWFSEAIGSISDLILIPLFLIFFAAIYLFCTSGKNAITG